MRKKNHHPKMEICGAKHVKMARLHQITSKCNILPTDMPVGDAGSKGIFNKGKNITIDILPTETDPGDAGSKGMFALIK